MSNYIKKSKLKVSTPHILHIRSTKNNTSYTVTTLKGLIRLWQTSGSSGFKGPKRRTETASDVACENICSKMRKSNISEIFLVFWGRPRWRRKIVRRLMRSGFSIKGLKDKIKIPHNGTPFRKKRR